MEFLNTSSTLDAELRLTLSALAEAHPIVRNFPLVQKVLSSPDVRFSAQDLNGVLRAILQRSVQLARTAPTAKPQEQFLTVCEQSVLTNAAVTLSAALSAQMASSLDRLSKIASVISKKE
jgi:hypothetical protein